jgi:preprotein translocase subunit SecF
MKKLSNIDFVAMFKFAGSISLALLIGTIVLFFTKGVNYGIDFRGGVEMQVKFQETIDMAELRAALNERQVPLSQLQSLGSPEQNEFIFKLDSDGDLNAVSNLVANSLSEIYGADTFEILKTDIVGPKAGVQLRTSAFKALFWAILGIMIYLALRFDYKFAPGAIIALTHDVAIIMGVFILTQKEFSLQIVAALLAVIGYSVNDTVVIYDRVREIENRNTGASSLEVINLAINETMARTLNTSLTALGVSVVMLIWGGPVIHDFFFAITFGILLGVYSTIFVAVPMTVFFERFMNKNQKVA